MVNADYITSITLMINDSIINFSKFNSNWLYELKPTQVGLPNGNAIIFNNLSSNIIIGNSSYGLI